MRKVSLFLCIMVGFVILWQGGVTAKDLTPKAIPMSCDNSCQMECRRQREICTKQSCPPNQGGSCDFHCWQAQQRCEKSCGC